uniref:Desmoplakin b n=1 Tax=Gadus morhua TaxID=8049 RepID=A0A8C4ZPH9_GADMO
ENILSCPDSIICGDALKCAVVCFQRLIETSPWGDDQETLQQQLVKHQMFHSSIQRSDEMDRARDELHQNGDKASLNALDQEWDSLQKMSFSRSEWLQELQLIIEDISKEIMWVNYREEEELVFDWGERNIDLYIPKKQESYSQLMSALEGKERDLNRLKVKVDVALKNNHPASDKIEAYMDTLQTQWSWLLQITKCIHVHLKENAAYSQFFKEANETYGALQKEHETIRKKFTCDKDTSLDSLLELLAELEKEKEKILENKRQVQHLVNMSKSIVRLKPRNPEEKSSSTVIVRALCDFKQDQKVICKDNEGILKDNSQRSKWQVTGPGGLDMLVPSVCLLVPPPNPISISMAKKNDQYYEAILSIWNQLYINIKSLISWQYCCMDIENINSLTVAMLSRMSSEEYRSLIKQLETHYAEFRVNSHGSQMIEEEDLMTIESQYNGAQNHYEQLVVQLPSYTQYASTDYGKPPKILEINHLIKSFSHSLMELRTLRTRMESAEGSLNQHIHISLGDDKVRECGLRITELEVDGDILRIKDMILMEVEGMADADKAQFLRSDIGGITQRLGVLDSSLSAYLQRLRALRNLLESVSHGEDIVKVHEARLTEKDTTSLSPGEVEDYIMYLKNMKVELDQKRDVFDSMEAEMEKANNWNSQVGDSSLRCDMTLATYSELVGQLTNRWRRIHTQIDCRWDLEFYVPQLQQYKKDSTSLDEWIDSTQKRQKALQSTKIEDLETVVLHISQQKALNSEIKEKRRTLDSVLTESGDCVSSIKDYESDLAAYGSGLETLLNIPIKRTILTSPSTELNQEAVEMQTRYMELFTLSGDYYTYLGAMQKNMEELKIRNTRIDLLEEELRLLKGSIESNTTKNRQLQDALARYQLELSNSKEQLLSVENGNEDESRKRRLAEDRYNKQKEEYEILLRRAEKNMTDKEREAEQLRQRLADESARVRELQLETSKVRAVCIAEMRSLKLSYESQIQASHADIELLAAQREEAANEQKLQCDRMEAEKKDLQEELTRHWLSIGEAEEGRRRAEQQALSQLSVIAEEGRQRRDLEEQLESLIRQREADDARHRVELVELKKTLEDKSAQVAYVTHSLSEETRRRTTIEEGQNVLEETLAKLHMELASSSVSIAGLKECEEGLERMHFEIERQVSERSRAEQNIIRLQGRIKDLQSVRDVLESQVEVLRKSNQEEVNKRKMIETELEQTTITIREYSSNLNLLLKSQEKATTAEKRVEEELLRLKGELDQSLRQNKTSSEHLSQLSFELLALQQNLLQEQAFVKEANLCKENLYKSIEEKSEALNQNSVELQKWKENTETLTKERVRLEEVLLVVSHERDELLRSKLGNDEELVTQVSALEHQWQSSNRRSLDYKHLVTELSTEREKFKLEIEKTQKHHFTLINAAISISPFISYLQTTEDLERIKLSLESECHIKQRLQEENDRLKNEFRFLKDKYDSQESKTRQHDSDKDRFEQEINDLKGEIQRLRKDSEVIISRKTMATDLKAVREPPNLIFDGVRKTVTAKQLHDCGVLDELTFNKLLEGKKRVPAVSVDKKVILKGTGPIAGVVIASQKGTFSLSGPLSKMSLTEAKKGNLIPLDCADLLLDAQAATGHMIDPRLNQKLTVEEACDQGLVDENDRQRLLAAEAAAVGYHDPGTGQPLSAFQAMKKGLIDKSTALRLLQAQECTGGILDPTLSVFLPKDIAIERDLINEDIYRALNQRPELYMDPETELGASYISLKRRCQKEPNTGLLLLPVSKKLDPSKLVFDGVRKPVTAKQLNDCGPTFKELVKGDKTVPQVSLIKRDSLKGTGCISGVIAGKVGKMSFDDAKKQGLLSKESADLLLEAQAATGHIIDPRSNHSLTVEEACDKGVVAKEDRERLLAAEAAAIGYNDRSTSRPLSVFDAIKKGLVDMKTALTLLQAQESAGGILDPVKSVFLPKDTAIKHNLLDEELKHALNQQPEYYIDPETEKGVTYESLKRRCKTESHTGLILLPISGRQDPNKLIFDGTSLKGTGAIAAVIAGDHGKISFAEAKKQGLIPTDSANKLLEAQAATGHIIDPETNTKLTVEEACVKGVVAKEDRERLLAAESAAIGYNDRTTAKPLSVFEALNKGITEYDTGLLLLPISGKQDPNKLIFDGVRKPVTAQQLLDCGVLDKPTFNQLLKKEKTIPDVSKDKKISLKGTGAIAAVIAGDYGKMSFAEAKKQGLIPTDSANKLLEAQAATGHIIDPETNKKLTVEEACVKGVVAKEDRERLLAAESAAIGYTDRTTAKCLSVFEALKKGIVDKKNALTLLQAQESAGGILDPVNSVFLPRDTAIKGSRICRRHSRPGEQCFPTQRYRNKRQTYR